MKWKKSHQLHKDKKNSLAAKQDLVEISIFTSN
jgi:hypothetical protein